MAVDSRKIGRMIVRSILLLTILGFCLVGKSLGEDLQALYQEGEYALKAGELERAITIWTAVLDRDPSNVLAYSGRAAAFSARNDFVHAMADLDAAIKVGTNTSAVYRSTVFQLRARILVQNGDQDAAIDEYNRAIALAPNKPESYLERAEVWSQKRNWDNSIRDCSNAIHLAPTSFEAFKDRGIDYQEKGEWDKAINDYTRCIELIPSSVEALRARGFAWSKLEKWDRAIADYSRAIDLAPSDAKTYFNRGVTFSRKGDNDKALNDYTEAINRNPNYSKAYYGRALVFSRKGDNDKALNDYTEAMKRNSNDSKAYYGRALVFSRKGDWDSAFADCRMAVQIEPDFAEAENELAWLYATCPDKKLRNGKEAVATATKACELTSWKSWNYLDTLAAAYAEAGQFDLALKWEKEALSGKGVPNSRIDEMNNHLRLYQDKKPFRQPVPE